MRKNKTNPVKVMVCWAVVLAVLAVLAGFGVEVITDYRAKRLTDMQAQVTEINTQRSQEYAAEMAEYQKKLANKAVATWPDPNGQGWEVLDLTAYPLENVTTVAATRAEVMNNGLLLVNEWHARPDDFDETEIVSVGNYTRWSLQVHDGNVKLFPKAIDALVAAVTDAKQLGFIDYLVSEGYRTWETQNTYFQNKVAQLEERYSGDELIARAKKEVNYPGTSEFNSGLSFTLRLYNKEDASIGRPDYYTTAAGQWMNENCWKYGLIFRFPLEDFPLQGTISKASKTGVSVDLNLYRYVGKGHAAAMHALDMCLEEYIEYLQDHPHIAIYENGELRYEIYRQLVGDAPSFNLEINRRAAGYESSLDNMGAVVTVFEY